MAVQVLTGGTTMGRNRKSGEVVLKEEDTRILTSLANSQTAEHRKVQRAKIILLAGEGFSNAEILTQRNSFRSVLIITQDPLYGHGALDAVSFAAKLDSVGYISSGNIYHHLISQI